MVKRHAGVLELPLDEGTRLQVELKRQRILTCDDLRNYLGSLTVYKLLQVKGQGVRVSWTFESSRSASRLQVV